MEEKPRTLEAKVIPKSPTNVEDLKRIMATMKEEYETTSETLNEVYANLKNSTIATGDLPLVLREEFDQRFKRKTLNVE